ncbi:MAG: hypothetical protein DI628_08570 [Blastochloris viridis]|uniref:Type II secretion system protein GspF domain-containing protein n=1 Tax=Blastochloris viridis TaxID=1079 RepID=A0A6N4RB96_BLAVI|nr:MAG: hypothetical protein DI628_08570 [Blastochloris viridis]
MGIQFGKAGFNTSDRIDFFKTLSGWMNSGAGQMSLGEAVANTTQGFSQEEYATLAPQMSMIERDVAGGQTPLYQALAMANVGFKPQELAIIEAAEKGNQLRQALPALVEALEVESSGRRDLMSKMAGPIIIGVMLIALSIGVLIFMLPMVIQPVLDRNAEALMKFPFILRMFWYTSVWLRANPMIPIVLVGVLVAGLLLRNAPLVQPHWIRFTMWWGVTRKLILGFNAMVSVFFIPALVRSGMPTYMVLEQMAYCVSHPLIRSQYLAAAEDHRNGMRMSQAVEGLPFRASFFNAIVAGESTGAIAARVEDLQLAYKLELERYIRQVSATLKFIVMTVLLPLFIICTYTSLVGPIFALMEYGR